MGLQQDWVCVHISQEKCFQWFNSVERKKKVFFFYFECTVFSCISLNIHENETKHLAGFQKNVFNYPDFSLHRIPGDHFLKQLHLTAQGHLKQFPNQRKPYLGR